MRGLRAAFALTLALGSCGASAPLPAPSDASTGSRRVGSAGSVSAPVPVPSALPPTPPGDEACTRRLRAVSGRIVGCAEAAHRRNPRTAGATSVRLDVTQGAVSQLVVLHDSTGDATYVGCIDRSLRGADFLGLSCSVPRYTWNLHASVP